MEQECDNMALQNLQNYTEINNLQQEKSVNENNINLILKK